MKVFKYRYFVSRVHFKNEITPISTLKQHPFLLFYTQMILKAYKHFGREIYFSFSISEILNYYFFFK